MLRQFLKKRQQILQALYKSLIRSQTWRPYEPEKFWNETAYSQGVSDRQTISRAKDALTAAYHYSSIEVLILRHLRNASFPLDGATVCDLGSGSGHWIEFFLSLGASRCIGIELSGRAADFLKRKYVGNGSVTIHQGKAADILANLDERPNIVSAIGFMFHLVDDSEWETTIRRVGAILMPGGLFIVGGHFGWIDQLRVRYYKKLRSRAHWRRSLRQAAFDLITIRRNIAYLLINDTVPENNVLIAQKALSPSRDKGQQN